MSSRTAASSSLLTAVRLCVGFLLVILLAVQGAVAQLGEHLVCNQGVVGSNPIRSIRLPTPCPPPTGCRFSPSSPIALTSSRGDGFAPLDSAWRRSRI